MFACSMSEPEISSELVKILHLQNIRGSSIRRTYIVEMMQIEYLLKHLQNEPPQSFKSSAATIKCFK